MHELTEKVLQTIKREQLLAAGDTVLVALSGGADSVALLRILRMLSERLSLREIRALHVHHGLRGEAADRDEAFVRELCDALHVPLTVTRVDTRAEAAMHKESIEEAGRRLRYAFFEQEAACYPQSVIATAHSASDRAETVLLNLIRGSGSKGACGIPIRRGRIVRPLLECTSREIRSFCEEQGFRYVTDETNTELCYARNRIRHTVLPAMRTVNPNTDGAILRFSDILREEDRFLHEQTQRLLEKARLGEGVYSVNILCEADPVLQRRAVLLMYADVQAMHVQALCELLCSLNGGCVNLPKDVSAVSDGKSLRFVKRSRAPKTSTEAGDGTTVFLGEPLAFGKEQYLPTLLSAEEYREKIKIHKNLFNFCVSYDMINSDLFVRSRKAGDTVRPFGRGCTKSLKKLFNELHIPCEKRPDIPVVTDGERVLSVLGICTDEAAAVTDITVRVLWFQKLQNNIT